MKLLPHDFLCRSFVHETTTTVGISCYPCDFMRRSFAKKQGVGDYNNSRQGALTSRLLASAYIAN